MADGRRTYHRSSEGSSSGRVTYHSSGGGGSSSRATYHAGETTSTGPHKSVHGIGGFFHTLAHGAGAAARGFAPVLAPAGKDALEYGINHQKGSHAVARDFVKPISHQYAEMYTPLFRNDWNKFGHNVYND